MIWKRYFYKEIFKVFFLFLFSFFFLYALLDYSTHIQDFIKDSHIQIREMLLYYSFQFIKRADLLLPLALLLATIKVLTGLNAHRELVALQTAAIPMRKLLAPFFLVALGCTLFNYWSFQALTPKSLNYLDTFRKAHFRHAHNGPRKEPFHVHHFKDNSKLIYQYFDPARNEYFDVLWIRSSSDIYRIKALNADPTNPEVRFVDHLVRNSQGFFEKKESFEKGFLEGLHWKGSLNKEDAIPYENRSITELFRLYFNREEVASFTGAEILAHFSFKCLMPLLSFLVVIACTPFCIRYSRGIPLFFIYALSLFAFLAFFTLMDAAVIIGKNGVLPPFLAIFTPFAICGSFFSWKYIKST